MILRLANIAMHATDAFNPFILALDERLDQCDYAGALLIARAMVQQEDVLLGAAQGISKMSSNKLQ
ncbi:hypothetical protein [Methylobacterium sp. SI9]|uniref:hypothetical protein n=1 Tax=Methylobacterium guangdongense TaxID=3138811 RepID=UPI00313D8A4A